MSGLCELDEHWAIVNFYCVKNDTTKKTPTKDFDRYCELRDSKKAFYLYEGCKRRWMNQTSDERGAAGLEILWPDTSNASYLEALANAANGDSPNNISCILKYSLESGVTMLWMGDLDSSFMESILDEVKFPKIDILFAPHHGRTSGKVPREWLTQMDPSLIIVGEASSDHLHYYPTYNTITQNSAGDILFECLEGEVHIYASDANYQNDLLHDDGLDHSHGLYYVGTLSC